MPETQSKRRWTRGHIVAGVVVVIALAVGLPLGISLSSARAGGDPGGAILRELLATRSDAPGGSSPTTYISQDATWIGSCSDATLTPGWGIIQGVTSFSSTLPVQQVQSYVGHQLALAGWEVSGPARRMEGYVDSAESYTYLRRWTKVLPQKVTATLSLQTSVPVHHQQSDVTRMWLIGGTANPIPPVGFCGGG